MACWGFGSGCLGAPPALDPIGQGADGFDHLQDGPIQQKPPQPRQSTQNGKAQSDPQITGETEGVWDKDTEYQTEQPDREVTEE